MSISTDDFAMSIIDALSKRNFVFQRATNAIAKKIDFVFEAIIEYLEQNAMEVEWESIDISNDLLVVVAKLPGKTNHRVLSVGVPLDVVQQQSKDKVIEFFVSTEKERKQREGTLADMINDVLEQYGTEARVKGSDDDVDPLYDFEDNDVVPERTSSPKRILH